MLTPQITLPCLGLLTTVNETDSTYGPFPYPPHIPAWLTFGYRPILSSTILYHCAWKTCVIHDYSPPGLLCPSWLAALLRSCCLRHLPTCCCCPTTTTMPRKCMQYTTGGNPPVWILLLILHHLDIAHCEPPT